MNPVGLVPTLLTDEANHSDNRWRLLTGWRGTTRKSAGAAGRTGPQQGAGNCLCHACDIHPLNNLRVLRYLTEERTSVKKKKNVGMRTGSSKG